MATVFPFYEQYYHTNFDTKETYDEDVARFNTEFYGSLAVYAALADEEIAAVNKLTGAMQAIVAGSL
jgi:hypothetical protein